MYEAQPTETTPSPMELILAIQAVEVGYTEPTPIGPGVFKNLPAGNNPAEVREKAYAMLSEAESAARTNDALALARYDQARRIYDAALLREKGFTGPYVPRCIGEVSLAIQAINAGYRGEDSLKSGIFINVDERIQLKPGTASNKIEMVEQDAAIKLNHSYSQLQQAGTPEKRDSATTALHRQNQRVLQAIKLRKNGFTGTHVPALIREVR